MSTATLETTSKLCIFGRGHITTQDIQNAASTASKKRLLFVIGHGNDAVSLDVMVTDAPNGSTITFSGELSDSKPCDGFFDEKCSAGYLDVHPR